MWSVRKGGEVSRDSRGAEILVIAKMKVSKPGFYLNREGHNFSWEVGWTGRFSILPCPDFTKINKLSKTLGEIPTNKDVWRTFSPPPYICSLPSDLSWAVLSSTIRLSLPYPKTPENLGKLAL